MKNRNKGIVLSYAYFVINTILSIVISSFIVRTIGKTSYGVYQTVTAFAAYLVLLEFGTGTVMTRNISLCKKDGTEKEKIDRNISTIWTLTVILAVAIVVVSVVFYLLIDSIYTKSLTAEQIVFAKQLFVWVIVNMVFSFLTHTLNGMLLGYEFYVFEKIVSLCKLLLRSGCVVLLLLRFPNAYSLVVLDASIAMLVFSITLLFSIFKIKPKLVFHYFDKEIFRFITPLCLAMLLQTIVNTANGSVDKFLISVMMTPDDVSIYAISMTMFTMFSSVGCIPLTMFMPKIAENMKKGMQGEDLSRYLIAPCRLNALILCILAGGILAIGQQFLVIVYGETFAESWIYAIIVIIPMLFNMFNGVMVNVMDVLNKRHVRSLILMITTALNIILTIVGIKQIGMLGAAIATGVSMVLQTVILNIYYRRKFEINVVLLFKESFSGILSCTLIATALAYPMRYIIRSYFLQFVVGGIVFVVTFGVLFMLFGVRNYEKEYLKNKLNFVSRKIGISK